jgi:flagellar biosynthesis/type III secretory pathway M-ring protein FliF/YscJ
MTRNIIIGIGAFGLVLVVAGGWLLWRNRQSADADEDDAIDDDDAEGEEGADEPTQEEIMDAIVALDDQLKSGNISDQAYKERRAELKEKLRRML